MNNLKNGVKRIELAIIKDRLNKLQAILNGVPCEMAIQFLDSLIAAPDKTWSEIVDTLPAEIAEVLQPRIQEVMYE